MSTSATPQQLEEARQLLIRASKTLLGEMTSPETPEKLLAVQSDFCKPGFKYMLRGAFDGIWAREGLERKYRSLTVISILAATNKPSQLKFHVRAGLVNGLEPDEIRECLLHVMGYCGFPTGLEAFGVADEVIKAWHAEQQASKM
ncbi:hypothetical protein C6P46_002831 [Rhodotorula mucilaginosa]|uniref:Carboxymuconolactone decarboxylase-like domain-containing protein n=1 Tax=Rhodotorula mucilaginosa TaxID=5537 RepID=A0A9P6W459_RHOMI|nr:hypothetical protein C6P46_002831 [Rhodotorula mucilaginosa]TKA52330.1 hypothetical protein B0A53_04798 [Rhodotorula sp. CCFEE 5036]